MAEHIPTIEGFRAIFRRPALGLAELAWRWVFGAAGWMLLVLSLFEYLNTLPVTPGDALFLRSRHPFLVSQAVAHILAGSGQRLTAAGIVVGLALAVLWIVSSSLGRAATIQPLLEYFSLDGSLVQASADVASSHGRKVWHLRSLLGLNFLRVTLLLAGILALVSAGIIGGFVSTPAHPRPGLAFLIFLSIAALVALSWSSMNWFLSIASIFVVRDSCDVFGSISSAVEFCLRRARAVSWSSTVFGTCHLVVFVLASSVVVFPLAFVGLLPRWIIFGAVVLLTLAYFVVVDFFYVGRLAAYVCILETPEEAYSAPALSAPLGAPMYGGLEAGLSSSISGVAPGPTPPQSVSAWPPIPSSDDDILSDVPLPPPESQQS